MTTAAIALVLIVLLGYALERNHRRQPGPRPPLAGSSDLPDRDTQRVLAELAQQTQQTQQSSGRSPGGGQQPSPRRNLPVTPGSTAVLRSDEQEEVGPCPSGTMSSTAIAGPTGSPARAPLSC
ncbi:hypothetical protein [Streptacidiphilus sp. PAMC 29251]